MILFVEYFIEGGGKMPRISRKESFSGFYHVMVRGINKEKIFQTNPNKEKALEIIGEKNLENKFHIYAYCIMDNHIHLLVKSELDDLSTIMKRINVTYAMYYNSLKGRIGPVFQDRFKSENVEDERYLYGAIRYIHNNPVVAKIITKPAKYKWSSMQEYLTGKDGLIGQEAREFIHYSFKTKSKFTDFHSKADNNLYLEVEEDLKVISQEIGNRIVREFLKKNQIGDLSSLSNKDDLIVELLRTGRFTYEEISKLAGCSKYSVYKINKSR